MWEGVGDWTKTAIYWPPLLWPSALCLSRSPGLLNRRPRGPLCWVRAFSTASCHQRVYKLHRGSRGPHRPGVAFPTTSDFLSSPSYIIFQLPTQSSTQSLEWHVWSSSSGNNCHAVQRSLSSGASVYEWVYHGLLPCPISSAKSAYAISFDYWPLECVTSFRCITLEWHV